MQFSTWAKRYDWALFSLVLIISIMGVLTFFLIDESGPDLAKRQIVFIGIGAVLMLAISFFDYRIFKNSSVATIVIYVIAIALLAFTLFTQEIRGAQSWITIFGLRFEPSEPAKLALLILLAKYFSQKHVDIYSTRHILASGFYAGIPAGITFLQSDLGSMMVFVGLWLGMLMFAGIDKRHLLAIFMIGVVLVSAGWFFVLQPYQKDRLISFVNPYEDPYGSGYNTIQSRTTLGSGLWTGTYFSERDSKTSVLVPEPYTDFIFAAYAQKYGFLGLLVLLTLLVLIMMRIGSIAMDTNNNFAKLYSLGLVSILFIHILINGGMNLGIFPITGIPFPLLSQGGSHLLTLMIGVGLVQSIRLRRT